MKNLKLLATRAGDGQYMKLIRSAYEQTNPRRICAAVAYATHSGVAELDAVLQGLPGWKTIRKQWLVGIDYCRSDPVALMHLKKGLQKSEVRIFDGQFVSGRTGCVPRYSYHPKAWLLIGPRQSAVVVGSGNLSRTGLLLGIEAAAAVSGPNAGAIKAMRSWFSSQWCEATSFADIKDQYRKQHGSIENLRHPPTSEDDAFPESVGRRGQFRPDELRKLRVCRHLWIEAGKVTRNRGPKLPGNQLMMKRNSRVFFGFTATDLERNSVIGDVAIRFDEHLRPNCSLRFGDNSMDVLTLPVPGQKGPEAYDRRTLHFERIGLREFKLTIGRPADVEKWKQRSASIEGEFSMKRGRRWGVY